jgi:hypothetical protein
MTVITIAIQQFKKSILDRNRASMIFESQDRIVALIGNSAIIQAFKTSPEKLSKDSIPLKAIGYPGISTADCKRLDIDLAEEIHANFDKLSPEEQAKILKELATPKEETEAE